ncbi:MAG: EamA family transporter [Gemmatimonadota bacterium]
MKQSKRTPHPEMAIWLLVFIWGSNFSVLKYAFEEIEPLALNGIRFVLASVLLALFLRMSGERLVIRRSDWGLVVGLGILGNTIYQVLFIVGLSLTLAGNSSLMLATVPVFVALLSVARRHEHIRLLGWLGIFVSVAGIAFVVVGGSRGVGFGATTLRGDMLSLVAALVWSVYTVGTRPLVREYGTLPVTALTMWIGAAALLAVATPSIIRQPWTEVSLLAWAALVYSGVLGIAVAYVLWNYGIRHLGSSRTALYSNTIPIVAILVAWATIGEVPTSLQVVGTALVLGGILLARASRKEADDLLAGRPGTKG